MCRLAFVSFIRFNTVFLCKNYIAIGNREIGKSVHWLCCATTPAGYSIIISSSSSENVYITIESNRCEKHIAPTEGELIRMKEKKTNALFPSFKMKIEFSMCTNINYLQFAYKNGLENVVIKNGRQRLAYKRRSGRTENER